MRADNSHRVPKDAHKVVSKLSTKEVVQIVKILEANKDAISGVMTKEEVKQFLVTQGAREAITLNNVASLMKECGILPKFTRASTGKGMPKDGWHRDMIFAKQLLELMAALGHEGTYKEALNNMLKAN